MKYADTYVGQQVRYEPPNFMVPWTGRIVKRATQGEGNWVEILWEGLTRVAHCTEGGFLASIEPAPQPSKAADTPVTITIEYTAGEPAVLFVNGLKYVTAKKMEREVLAGYARGKRDADYMSGKALKEAMAIGKESPREFKVGNFVRVVKPLGYGPTHVGDVGRVVGQGASPVVMAVEFPAITEAMGGHDCVGMAAAGHGFFMKVECLERIV